MPRIRIKHGESEIELDGPDDFIKTNLDAFYIRIGASFPSAVGKTIKAQLLEEPRPKEAKPTLTPAEFYKSKGKTDGVSQILIFGKYLEDHRSVAEFSKSEINQVAKEAKIPKDIHSQYFTNAVKQGLLRSHPNGRYSLTISAEEVLASM